MSYVLVELAGRNYDKTADFEPMKVWSQDEINRFLATLPLRISAVFVDLRTGMRLPVHGTKCDASLARFVQEKDLEVG